MVESWGPSSSNSGNRSIEFSQQEPSESLVISMEGKLACQDGVESSWDNLSIYKIPPYLRNSTGDDKAYVPRVVSSGPYHHGKPHLSQMEQHKWRSLDHVLKRTGHDISLYVNSMKEIEDKARSFYEGPISLTSNEFVEMLVLDGCFVLEVFRGAEEGFTELGYSPNDPFFAPRRLLDAISKDLIMLENQLPLFVLDRILGLQLENPDQKGLVADLALKFFNVLMTEAQTYEKISNDPLSYLDGLHCLDVFRRSLLYPGPGPQPTTSRRIQRMSNRQDTIPCVTELKEVGIKFEKRKTDRFCDIKFDRGTLQIPRLLVDEDTKTLFLNLIAFEQCHLCCSKDISVYAFFMDYLINSQGDVAHLIDCGIIEHWLGSDVEVAKLFNGLSQEVMFYTHENYLSTILDAVNMYYERSWNRWYANLRHNYFTNPWTIISLIAAVVLLLFTFAQTFYTVYAYYRPRK